MRHNLFTPLTGKLNYPHCTKNYDGIAHVVTHPEKIIVVNDVIYSKGENGLGMRDYKVLDVLEQRVANGEHSVDFVPVFQKLKVRPV